MKPLVKPFYLVFSIFFFCTVAVGYAQSTLDANKFMNLRRTGSVQMKKGEYKEAINTFTAAKTYLPLTDTRSRLSIGDSIQKAYQSMVENLDLARKKAVAEAKASELAGVAYDLAKSNPTLGLRVAEFAAKINPQSRSANQQLSDILGITPSPFFSKVLQHDHKVLATTYAASAGLFLTATDDGQIHFWDKQGSLKRSIQAHKDEITIVKCAPTEAYFVTGGVDNLIKLWTYSGDPIAVFKGHIGDITDLAFSLNGNYLVSASRDQTIKIWDKQGTVIRNIPAHEDLISAIDVSPDGQLIASASWDKTVKIWDFEGQQILQIPAHKYGLLALAFSPDGKSLATSSWDAKIKTWDLKGKELNSISLPFGNAIELVYLPSNELVIAGDNANIYTFKPSGEQIQMYQGHFARISNLNFSATENMLLSSSEDGSVLVWPLKGLMIYDYPIGSKGTIQALSPAYGKEAQYYYAQDSALYLADLKNGKHQKLFQSFYAIKSMSSSSATKQIVIGGLANLFTVIDENGKKLYSIDTLTSNTNVLEFSKDGQWIVSGLSNGEARLWGANLTLKTRFVGHQDQVLSADISPDNELIATASMDGYVFLWKKDGTLIDTLHYPRVSNDQVFKVAFSPDGQYIAAGGKSRYVEVWNRKGELVHKLSGHKGYIIDLGFSKQSNLFYSLCNANILRIWNEHGQLIQSINNGSPVVGALLASDGNTFTTWDEDNHIRQRYTAQGFFAANLLAALSSVQKKSLDSLSVNTLEAFTIPPILKDESLELFIDREIRTRTQYIDLDPAIHWYWYLGMSLRQKAELSTNLSEKIFYANKGVQSAKITMAFLEKRGPMFTHLYNNPAFCYGSLALFHAAEGRFEVAQTYLDTAFNFKCEDMGKAVVQGKKALILALNNKMEEAKNLVNTYGSIALNDNYLNLHGLLANTEFKEPFTVKDEIQHTILGLEAVGLPKEKIAVLKSLILKEP